MVITVTFQLNSWANKSISRAIAPPPLLPLKKSALLKMPNQQRTVATPYTTVAKQNIHSTRPDTRLALTALLIQSSHARVRPLLTKFATRRRAPTQPSLMLFFTAGGWVGKTTPWAHLRGILDSTTYCDQIRRNNHFYSYRTSSSTPGKAVPIGEHQSSIGMYLNSALEVIYR